MKNLIPFFIFFLAALPSSFAGHYMEYKIISKGEMAVTSSMKIWHQNGNLRFEIHHTFQRSKELKEAQKMGFEDYNIVGIELKDKPNKMHMLNEKEKSYTITETNSQIKENEQPASDYTITVVGEETVNGNSCTHLIVKDKKEKEPFHLWLGKPLKGMADIFKLGEAGSMEGFQKVLVAKGFGEKMVIKMKAGKEDDGMVTELVKYEEMEVPAAKFSLSGYKLAEKVTVNPYGGAKETEFTPEEKKAMQEGLKDMPEEERKAYMNMLQMMPAESRKMMIDQLRKAKKEGED